MKQFKITYLNAFAFNYYFMSKEVIVAGIDGSGKSTTISDLVDRLSSNYVVAHSGRPSYVDGPSMNQRNYLFENSISSIDKMHEIGDELKSKSAIALANIVNVALWRRRHEKIIKHYNPDIIFSGRHRTIDSAVYSTYYFPLAAELPHSMRTSIAEGITKTGQPDLFVYLDISPETAVKRIESRIEKENKKTGVVRPKWKHMHENVEDLKYLKKDYERILNRCKKLGWNIHTINVEESPQNEVADRIEELIIGRI